jgi:chitinase
MPFVDVTMWPPYKLQDGVDENITNFALAFVNSAGSCSPTWGAYKNYTINNETLNLPKQIKEVLNNGGHVMVSFGGATALANELANTCTTVATLADAYQSVIDSTGVKMLDFDIEGSNSYNKVNILRRMKALKIIQDNNPDVEISFTLATMPTGLLATSGLMIVKTAIDQGVKFKMINLMLMDYGYSFPAKTEGGLKMAAYSIQALQSVNAQLKVLLDGKTADYPANSNGEYYNMLGATPMIGRNDILDEWFFKDDIEQLTKFCNQVGVRMTSMWSLNRDKAIVSGEGARGMLYQSTKLTPTQYGNGKYEFSKLLKR